MESKNSFVSRMKGCGLPVEKWCFIFSIINMIIVSTCVAASIYYIVWVEHLNLQVEREGKVLYRLALGFEVFALEVGCIILSVCCGISFIFAVLLCYGAYKKLPKFLLAYFVFGVIVEIFSTFGVILGLIDMMDNTDDLKTYFHGEVAVALTIMVIYILPLTVVYRAYRTLSDTTVLPSGHLKLVNIA